MTAVQVLRLAILTVIGISLATTTTSAQSNSKGRNSSVVVGRIVSVDDDIILVRQNGEDHQRKLTVTKKTNVAFVGFKGIGKPADAPQAGFGVKAKVAPGDILKSVHYTPLLPASRDITDKHKLTEAELFQKADLDHNKRVDYVEFSIGIHRSEKHGPDHFPKMDQDGDDTLDGKEFEQALKKVSWWRLSRKSLEEWMQTADKNGNRELSQSEFGVVCQSGNHLNQIFKRTDKDKSDAISLEELGSYLSNAISPKRKPSRKPGA